MVRAELATTAIDPARLYAEFVRTLGGEVGAVSTFTGLARARSRDGAQVGSLWLEHHPVLTAASLRTIGEAAADSFPVSAVHVVHRCGAIAAGEAIVWVAAASAHRRAALEAVDYLMDRLKTEAVFWKREDGPEGSSWIEPTADDHAARLRWE